MARFPAVTFADSDHVRVGDWIIAIGNPFGLGSTVTAGIISARSRDIRAGPYDDFLQVDAPINRGNSGGPSFNLDGEVIGINTAIFSPSGGNVGIGFAIPSNLALPVIESLKEEGRVKRGWLGVRIQTVTDEIAESLGLDEAEGALVASVTPGGPAEAGADRAGRRDPRVRPTRRSIGCAACRASSPRRRSARRSRSRSGAGARSRTSGDARRAARGGRAGSAHRERRGHAELGGDRARSA